MLLFMVKRGPLSESERSGLATARRLTGHARSATRRGRNQDRISNLPSRGAPVGVVKTKAGLPAIRIHDLRHSYASIALARGVHPQVVQEALGHSTIAVTLDLYSHVVPSLQREAAKEMGAALFG